MYLRLLAAARAKEGCHLHAYVLMTNHVHLLVTSQTRDGISRMMKQLGESYVPYFNARHGRSGTLWEGRFRSSIVESDRYLLTCHRYIEANPVRAAMVMHPGDYRWSSHRANAMGERDDLLTPHALYLSLGHSQADRLAAYRALLKGLRSMAVAGVLPGYCVASVRGCAACRLATCATMRWLLCSASS